MKTEYYLAAIILILILGAVVLVSHSSSSGFSVVYFENSTVPAQLVPGNTSTIVFVVESHEKDKTTYSFEVTLDGNVIDTGNFTLMPGSKAQIPIKVVVNNVTYERVVLWNSTTVYNVSGVSNITGNCFVVNSTDTAICLPPMFLGPSGLNFHINTTGNASLERVFTNLTASGRLKTVYRLNVIRIRYGFYKITLKESKLMYVPRNVLLGVTVKSSNGKVYILHRSFSVEEG